VSKTTVVVATQDRIELYEATARDFFGRVLDMNYDECLVTDLSALSDFSSCGLPDDHPETETLEQLYAAWDVWVTAKVREVYGIHLETTAILFVDLFEQIEQMRASVRLH